MRRRSALWFPLLLVGSVVYWTLALGLGGVSLALLGVSGEDLELTPPEVIPPRVASGAQSATRTACKAAAASATGQAGS